MSKLKTRSKQSKNKAFGILLSIVFLIVSIYLSISSLEVNVWALFLSVIFLLLTYVSPKIFSIPRNLWIKFGMLLSMISAPIVITLIYLVTIVPTGLIMRLLGKDLLKKKPNKNAKSYWIKRNEPIGSMKNQF